MEEKVKIRSLLELGEKPRDVADKLGVSYQKVQTIRRQMDKEKETNKVDDLIKLDPVALEMVVEKAKEEAPATVVRKLENIQEGLSGIQILDSEFQDTFRKVLSKAEEFLESDKLKPSEWVSITNALSNAYNNVFNNSGVNVHVDNSTQVSATSLSMFKGSMRG